VIGDIKIKNLRLVNTAAKTKLKR